MWTLLSFTGRFDPKFLQDSIEKAGSKQLPKPAGTASEASKRKTIQAQEARARLRQGALMKLLADLGRWLQPWQRALLEKYNSGELLEEANSRTLISGHGRLKRKNGTYVDIGGSTGGFLRGVLDDWNPPDLSEFHNDDS